MELFIFYPAIKNHFQCFPYKNKLTFNMKFINEDWKFAINTES